MHPNKSILSNPINNTNEQQQKNDVVVDQISVLFSQWGIQVPKKTVENWRRLAPEEKIMEYAREALTKAENPIGWVTAAINGSYETATKKKAGEPLSATKRALVEKFANSGAFKK